MPLHRPIAAALLALATTTFAAPPQLTPQPFVTGLSAPVEIVHANDFSGRLFVVEQGGRIRIVRNGALVATPYLDISPGAGGPVRTGGEQGLLGLAFHPAYATNGHLYVFYTRALAGDNAGNELVVARYTRLASNPDRADPASAQVIITVPHPQQTNHNGGKIAFGPDGYLYVAVGDGGGGGDPFGAGQNLNDLRGKLLRLDVNGPAPYAVPLDNPFIGQAGRRGEIWAYGLRNPWRFSFDRLNGDLFIGDVGQGAREEIDYQVAGAPGGRNYGWSVFEGTRCHNPTTNCSLANHVPPILEYAHDAAGGVSVTGGYRYRGGSLPALAGFYLYGDFGSGRVWAAEPVAGGAWTTTQVASVSNLSTFGEDENGELYAANIGTGAIVRLTPAATDPPRLANLSTRAPARTGEDVLIGGFIIGGTQSKTVVVRARGPSLAALGVPNALPNPVLQLFSGQTPIASNDDWGQAVNAAAIQSSGFAPSDSLESAVLVSLAPGAYTAVISGASGATGAGIVEVFEVGGATQPLVNIATRAVVGASGDELIGGFIIQGTGPRNVVVRARGPSLTAAGVANALQNPTLTVFAGSTPVATNDDWTVANASAPAVAARGFAPSDTREAALFLTLAPGAYTAVVSGANGSTGVGIVEVFLQ